MTRNERDFYRGFACAVATLARDHDEPSLAADLMFMNGISWRNFVAAKVDKFDRPKCLRDACKIRSGKK